MALYWKKSGKYGLADHKVIGVFLGTLVECYDGALYGFSADVLAKHFFPSSEDLRGVYAIYAVAYLFKPIGALLFGSIGDKYGRKAALSITIIGIALPTMVIGLLPTYAVIGRWSTLALFLCRFLQGIFWGAEYDGAAIYVMEHLGKQLRFTASAITRCTAALGLLVAVGVVRLCNAPIFPAWGWRVPFLLSFPLALVAFYYRQRFVETPDFQSLPKHHLISNAATVVKRQWKTIGIAIGLFGSMGATYQIAVMFMQSYLPMVLRQTAFVMPAFSTLMVRDLVIFMFLSGFLADKIGPMVVIRFGLMGIVIAGLFFIVAIQYQMINMGLAAAFLLVGAVAPLNALAHAVVIETFAIQERYRSIGLGHTIGSMLMSGSANYICMYLYRWKAYAPILYLIMCALFFYCMAHKLLRYCDQKEA